MPTDAHRKRMDYFVRRIVAHRMDTIELIFMVMDELQIRFTCGHTATVVDEAGVNLPHDVVLTEWCCVVVLDLPRQAKVSGTFT